MGCGIDSQRQAGNDVPASLRQRPGELPGIAQPLRCRVSTPHHGQAVPVQQGGVTQNVQHRRRVRGIEQDLRIIRVDQRQNVMTGFFCLGQGALDCRLRRVSQQLTGALTNYRMQTGSATGKNRFR